MLHFPDPALQTGHFICYSHRTHHLLPTVAKFGVGPQSIADYLALVGDSADGFPGVQGWGQKSAAAVLSRFPHLEDIPKDWRQWNVAVRSPEKLAGSLFESWADALLFRTLATLRLDVPVFDSVDELRWQGPRSTFAAMTERLKAADLFTLAKEFKDKSP